MLYVFQFGKLKESSTVLFYRFKNSEVGLVIKDSEYYYENGEKLIKGDWYIYSGKNRKILRKL